MPPPPPPPLKYVAKSAKSPPRAPSTSGPASAPRNQETPQAAARSTSTGVTAEVSPPQDAFRSQSSSSAPPVTDVRAQGSSHIEGRSRAMSRPAARPAPSSTLEGGDTAEARLLGAGGRPIAPYNDAIAGGSMAPQPAAPVQQVVGAPPLPVAKPPQSPTPSSAAVNTINDTQQQLATLRSENTVLKREMAQLHDVVETLQRDNTMLEQRLGGMMDCGLTPSMSTLDKYAQHKMSEGVLNNASARTNATSGAAINNGFAAAVAAAGLKEDAAVLETEFLRARVQRLEAALAQEMRARESLEDMCAAQKRVIVGRLAALQH